MEALLFWLFSALMLGFGLSVILNRNAVGSALSFAFTIVSMSALFVMLNAFFLAAVQILVTAGAVMVLFLFIIMLLDLTAAEHVPRQKVWMGCTLVLALGFVLISARALTGLHMGTRTTDSLAPVPATMRVLEPTSSASLETPVRPVVMVHEKPYRQVTVPNDDTHQIGRLLFTQYVAPFEVTSLLLLVATIGVIVICKQDDRLPRRPEEDIIREAPPRAQRDPAFTP